MTDSREFQDGEVIEGTGYRIIRLIGVGGMGSVYEVEHIELGKRFVLKSLLRELARREDLVQRLRNEWRALARLQHPNIVNVTDAGTTQSGIPYYVMERLDGATLAAVLRQKQRLHVLEAVHVTAAVLDALSAAHDIGIIHRDVKPANVFLAAGGGVKLLDFGIAKIADANSVVTSRGIAVGTPRYMSPEQARGERIDGRSDLYAAALILFEMVAGVGPFEDVHDANELLLAHLAREVPPLSAVVKGVSPELERIVARMLAKDCRERPAHARDGARLLRDFAANLRTTPATDAPTGKAYYGAATLAAARPTPTPNQDSITRIEGAARARSSEPSLSDVALTRSMELRSELPQTEATLSVATAEAFSVSSLTNTTLLTSSSFDGSTTQRMSPLFPTPPGSAAGWAPPPNSGPLNHPPVERPEPTEMLGEFTPAPPIDSWPTNTRVPVAERARPISVTPPPVVAADRVEAPRATHRGRAATLSVAGIGALALGVFLGSRAFTAQQALIALAAGPAKGTPLSTPAPYGAALTPSQLALRAAPATPAPAPATPAAAPATPATPPAAPAATPPSAPATPQSGTAPPISRVISDAKHLGAPSLKPRTPPAPPSVAPLARKVRVQKAMAPSAPAMPGSGL